MNVEPITRVTLADSVIDQLRKQILSGGLAPGERLPTERELCAAFGVGRTTVREALKGLTFDGAPQGPVTMRAEDNQAVVPSYLMRVRPGWTGVNDMFEQIQALPSVQPKPAACKSLPL